ncbi:MAG: hypothetical protein OXR68_01095 [Alphaproteobacteria bacterium]|nr:hypothetical protein [Alphaproteobacteria bacterium]MDD9919207.1 hypothetical protein [Alphaproteobacteria bacterium]
MRHLLKMFATVIAILGPSILIIALMLSAFWVPSISVWSYHWYIGDADYVRQVDLPIVSHSRYSEKCTEDMGSKTVDEAVNWVLSYCRGYSAKKHVTKHGDQAKDLEDYTIPRLQNSVKKNIGCEKKRSQIKVWRFEKQVVVLKHLDGMRRYMNICYGLWDLPSMSLKLCERYKYSVEANNRKYLGEFSKLTALIARENLILKDMETEGRCL